MFICFLFLFVIIQLSDAYVEILFIIVFFSPDFSRPYVAQKLFDTILYNKLFQRFLRGKQKAGKQGNGVQFLWNYWTGSVKLVDRFCNVSGQVL
jgi:hypothetical protein